MSEKKREPMLETLLWRCFVGQHQIEDAGISVAVSGAVSGEPPRSTLALRLDSKAFREAMKVAGPLCDGLLLGLVPPKGEEEMRVYCLFVEMKGKNIAHAVVQIENAIRLFRDHLREKLPEAHVGRTQFSAVIVSDRASPLSVPKEVASRFAKDLKARIQIVSALRNGPAVDLSDHLWRLRVPGPPSDPPMIGPDPQSG